jgi:hypothetical protein
MLKSSHFGENDAVGPAEQATPGSPGKPVETTKMPTFSPKSRGSEVKSSNSQKSAKVIDDRFPGCHNHRQAHPEERCCRKSLRFSGVYLKGFYHFPMSLSPGRFDQKVRRFRFSH